MKNALIKNWLDTNTEKPALEDLDPTAAVPVETTAVVAAAPEVEAVLEAPVAVATDVAEPVVEVAVINAEPVVTVTEEPVVLAAAEPVVEPAPVVVEEPVVEPIPALEDGDLPPLTDGETKLEVIVASEPSVDAVVGEIAEAQVKSDEIQQDVATLVEGQAAMERYMEILERAQEDGGLNQQAAAVLRVGMEQYEELFGLEQPLTPSVESFGGSMSQRQATTVSMEEISAQLKKAWEVIKAALKQLWAQIQDLYAKIVSGVVVVENRGKALALKARQVEKFTAANKTIKVTSPDKLFADGEWQGDKAGVAALGGIVAYVADKYPTSVAKYVSDLVDTLNEVKPQGLTAEGIDEVFSPAKELSATFPGKQVGQGDSQYVTDAATLVTDILAGNQIIVLRLSKTASSTAMTIVSAGGKAAPADYEIDVASAKDLGSRAIDLTKITQKLSDLSKHQGEAKAAIDKLIAAGDALKERADKEDLSAAQRGLVNRTLAQVTVVQRLLGTSYSGVLAYCVRSIAAQLAVVERQLAEYKPVSESK